MSLYFYRCSSLSGCFFVQRCVLVFSPQRESDVCVIMILGVFFYFGLSWARFLDVVNQLLTGFVYQSMEKYCHFIFSHDVLNVGIHISRTIASVGCTSAF
ncbi:uncharacterized protein LALA0_S03e09318g [Lachancea lanzarotensis]|uniref:LALA0S03e09318g1_1 n=1 Tax=Lachancea lanzarotensis TaxID=1245769 RepID=A0A0C7N519_9SACH|nr:uncharacterized protein LALA0_S03e09318g [Lachancea lanzarotensis]CEP61718.1 LALA0S03e09318g1_1 [Lachancea lanzarotensis]